MIPKHDAGSRNPYPVSSWKYKYYEAWKQRRLEALISGEAGYVPWDFDGKNPAPEFDAPEHYYRIAKRRRDRKRIVRHRATHDAGGAGEGR